jgi:chromosomal replication initiation ATPase DnaA
MKSKTIESYKIIKAIEKFSGIQIENNRSRKRNVVEAKLLFSKLMRDEGYTYQHIGDCIGLDHATVLYHCRNYAYVKRASKDLCELEIKVMDDVGKESQETIEEKIMYHKKQIEHLKSYLLHSTKSDY